MEALSMSISTAHITSQFAMTDARDTYSEDSTGNEHREWDITLTFYDHNWQLTLELLRARWTNTLHPAVTFVLVGQAEHGVRWHKGRPVQDDGQGSYHCHVALVVNSGCTKQQVFEYLQCAESNVLKRRWATPRNRTYTYTGWVMHHCKPRSKVPGNDIQAPAFQYGTCPSDTEHHRNATIICAMAKKYGFHDVYQEWLVIRERTRGDGSKPPRKRMPAPTDEMLLERRDKKRTADKLYYNKPDVRARKIAKQRDTNFAKMLTTVHQANGIRTSSMQTPEDKFTLLQLENKIQRFRFSHLYAVELRDYCTEHNIKYPDIVDPPQPTE